MTTMMMMLWPYHALAPCASFQAFLGYGYPSLFRGADDMIQWLLWVCSDLDSSPPSWVVSSYLSFCVLFEFFHFVFCSLPPWPSALWFRVRVFSSSSLRYGYILLTVGDGDMAAFFCASVSTCSRSSPRASIFLLFLLLLYPSSVSE